MSALKSTRSLRSRTPIIYADNLIDVTISEQIQAVHRGQSDSSDRDPNDSDSVVLISDDSLSVVQDREVPLVSVSRETDIGNETPVSMKHDPESFDNLHKSLSGIDSSASDIDATSPKSSPMSSEESARMKQDPENSSQRSDPMDIDPTDLLNVQQNDAADEEEILSADTTGGHEGTFVSADGSHDFIKKRTLESQDLDSPPRKHSRLDTSPCTQSTQHGIVRHSPPPMARDSFVGIDILPSDSPNDNSGNLLYSDPSLPPIEPHNIQSPSASSISKAHHISPLRQRRAIVSPAHSPSAARALFRDSTAKPRLVLSSKINGFSDDELSDEENDKLEKPIKMEDSVKRRTCSRDSFNIFSFLFHFAANLLIIVLVVTSTYFGLWYRQRQFDIGFCGQEQHFTPTFSDLDSPLLRRTGQYLDSHYLPLCVPCPAHARCFPNLEIGCYQDFVEHQPWSHFIKPHNTICVPDTLKAEKLEIMISVALDLLHHKNAQVDCGTLRNDEAAGISSTDLHDMLLSMKAPYISDQEFEDLWKKTCVELEREPTISVRHVPPCAPPYESHTNITQKTNAGGLGDGDASPIDEQRSVAPQNPLLRSTSLENVDLRCTVRNGVTNAGWAYKYQIISLSVILVTAYFVKKFYEALKLDHIKQDLVFREVLGKLYHQYLLALNDKSKPAYLGAMQLRDTILGNEHNIMRRVLLWNKVAKKVEVNTNVAIKIVEIHGEVMKVWEWVGG